MSSSDQPPSKKPRTDNSQRKKIVSKNKQNPVSTPETYLDPSEISLSDAPSSPASSSQNISGSSSAPSRESSHSPGNARDMNINRNREQRPNSPLVTGSIRTPTILTVRLLPPSPNETLSDNASHTIRSNSPLCARARGVTSVRSGSSLAKRAQEVVSYHATNSRPVQGQRSTIQSSVVAAHESTANRNPQIQGQRSIIQSSAVAAHGSTANRNPQIQGQRTGLGNEHAEFTQNFMKQLGNYSGVIPLEVTKYYMRCNGLVSDKDDFVPKLISLATQKFISDILLDVREKALLDQTASQRRVADKKLTLKPEMLESALEERGIEITRPSYYY